MIEIQAADKNIGMQFRLERTEVFWKAAVQLETETAGILGAALGSRSVVATGPERRAPPRQRCGPGRPMPHRKDPAARGNARGSRPLACWSRLGSRSNDMEPRVVQARLVVSCVS